MKLTLDELGQIAGLSLVNYRRLLALPRFARKACGKEGRLYWQHHFTVYRKEGGTEEWYLNGKLHRVQEGPNAGPAYIFSDYSEWYQFGKIHRDNGPASISLRGRKTWYKHGKIHREDGPAMIDNISNVKMVRWMINGITHRTQEGPLAGPAIITYYGTNNGIFTTEEWILNDRRHRIGGPAKINSSGHEEWWLDNKLHRVDGPTVIYENGCREWWCKGKRHRIGAPAIIFANGKERWYVMGKRVDPF
jgi:hypothetical protein